MSVQPQPTPGQFSQLHVDGEMGRRGRAPVGEAVMSGDHGGEGGVTGQDGKVEIEKSNVLMM
jgi:hypothetical protein